MCQGLETLLDAYILFLVIESENALFQILIITAKKKREAPLETSLRLIYIPAPIKGNSYGTSYNIGRRGFFAVLQDSYLA